ncbi:hypothetical protein COY33_01380 [candidate division WWE3 bacterium CG_4_10_14_0_2_um_filter_42_7]|uniref:Type II toxin-antitoxin system mRNA interferase toxin, RelE/StbE family n=2 Tax=Katanobacteria TaxID=422282 RepID=A0A2H0X9V0_UNCKA|nr:MAG: hypothetical protein COT51_01465 [candidate division WWE3 bacterium CG08_land_8_20_14_0_20_41_15]PIZ43534.1 MAG: hypothetical protein COY33_01380 [candidate division WWE3 bacterium CG_4_10_14_0_2_um_filter_42_7]
MKVTRVDYSKKFIRELKRAPREVKVAFRSRAELLLQNRNHPLLNNHSFLGKYENHRSINVSGDWRAIYQELDSGRLIFFIALGTHSQLCK